MRSADPYLNFNGNTEKAFLFYKSALNVDFESFQRYGEAPGSEKMLEAEREKLMHVSLPLGGGTKLMGSDSLESMGNTVTQGNNFHICLNADDRAEADRLFGALAEGGTVKMEMQDTFWGAYFGMLEDKFGVQWMVHHSVE